MSRLLHYQEDIRPLCFNGLYFVFLALAWTVQGGAWVATAFFLAICWTAFQGALQTHNAVHHPIFKARGLNRLYQVTLTLIYGHPVSNFVPGHNLSHHEHTQSERDVIRTSKARLPHNFLNLIFFFFRVAPDIIRTEWAYNRAMRTRHPRWFRQMVVEFCALWGLTALLCWLDWRKALVLWVLPHLLAQWAIVTINLLHHDGCDEDSQWDHSRNFVSPFFNWWIFNNGYHSIHHMYPELHWSKLPEAHAREVSPHIHPALEQQSFVWFSFCFFVLNQRRTFDDQKVEHPPLQPDQSWLPQPQETPRSLGAERLSGPGEDPLGAAFVDPRLEPLSGEAR